MARPAAPQALPVDLQLGADEDAVVERQGDHADRHAGVLADVAPEDVDDQLGEAVDDVGCLALLESSLLR